MLVVYPKKELIPRADASSSRSQEEMQLMPLLNTAGVDSLIPRVDLTGDADTPCWLLLVTLHAVIFLLYAGIYAGDTRGLCLYLIPSIS